MKQGVWSHVCGVVRISAMRKYKDMMSNVKYKIEQAPKIHGDNGDVLITILAESTDNLIRVDPMIEDYRATIVIRGDLENVTKEEVRNLEFNIHNTKEEQDRVEKFLTDIDKKIENNNSINNNLPNYSSMVA